MTVAEFVPLLVRERFPADLAAAVVNDGNALPELEVVCEAIDGGDAAMISVLFRELADRFARYPAEAAEILRSATPAAVLAAKVRAQHTNLSQHVGGPGSR
jgi:hypothetical protein